jgi:hypothetical protein
LPHDGSCSRPNLFGCLFIFVFYFCSRLFFLFCCSLFSAHSFSKRVARPRSRRRRTDPCAVVFVLRRSGSFSHSLNFDSSVDKSQTGGRPDWDITSSERRPLFCWFRMVLFLRSFWLGSCMIDRERIVLPPARLGKLPPAKSVGSRASSSKQFDHLGLSGNSSRNENRWPSPADTIHHHRATKTPTKQKGKILQRKRVWHL